MHVKLSENLSKQLEIIWKHKVWALFDWSRGLWPTIQANNGIGEMMEPFCIDSLDRVECESLQDELETSNASQVYDCEDDEDDEYDDYEEDEDTDLGFDHNNTNCGNSDSMCDEVETDDSRSTDQHSRSWNGPNTAIFTEFLELLYQLCLTICTESFNEGQPSSSLLVFFSGILGFSDDCRQFLLARQYCPHLSGLIYIQRLLLMESALPLHEHCILGIPERPLIGQLERLNLTREKYMVIGTQFPLAELISLRDFGRNIARTEPPAVLFSWSDDGQTLCYGDFKLTMEEFRKLPNYFISQAEEICNRLMLNLKPDIDLTIIRDDMANSHSGYSFVKHKKNGLDRAYLELLVSSYNCQENELARHGRWKWKSVTSYLKQVTELEEMLAGGLYTACGQTPRARDLLSLACETGPSTGCGISIWNGLMGYVLQHHKAKRQMGREFYVVRFLPLRLAHVMYKYLVYVRRFAALLRREREIQSPPCHHERLLFHSRGKPWSTSRLTLILMQATSNVWQYKVNIRIFRQMAISITERHVREIHSPQNIYNDTSADADLNVVFAWQSGHRPLQRGITYGLDGAFPNRLQPALLRAYEWASTRWHEFIRQPSKKATSLCSRTVSMSNSPSRALILKRSATCMMRNDESSGNHAIMAKKRKEPDAVKALIETIQGSVPNQRDQEWNCDAGIHSPNPRLTHRNEQLMREMPHFTYEEEYRLLGCRLCATMVTRQRIKEHLRGRPHQLADSEIKKVQEWASKLEIINDNREIYGLPLLPDTTRPIDVLGPPRVGGFRCAFVAGNEVEASTCRFVGSDTKRIREHLKHEHGWNSGLKPGPVAATAKQEWNDSPWRSGISYQRLFSKGPRSEYFEVARGIATEHER
jgi:hypothetical protein